MIVAVTLPVPSLKSILLLLELIEKKPLERHTLARVYLDKLETGKLGLLELAVCLLMDFCLG